MSVFQDIVKLWNSDDLLSQAWDESYKMMVLSNEIFNQAIKYLRNGENKETIIALKKRDMEINAYQKNVRIKVVTHYAVSQDIDDLPNGLVLLNMVVDVERVGDYTKNILDLALNHPNTIRSEDFSEDLHHVENEVIERFRKTLEAIHTQDADVARNLMKTYKETLTNVSDTIVNGCISGEIRLGDECQTVALALYARYLKRIGAHLKNITTVLVNPFDAVGYKQ
ncbi:PhoU domain-containing protein [Candidatus Marinimicrobia bacterium]|nr:PhoU domain-containing protein [Candidatus Neomarinimicrobiota bacterium]